jgi:hypothetical protein
MCHNNKPNVKSAGELQEWLELELSLVALSVKVFFFYIAAVYINSSLDKHSTD